MRLTLGEVVASLGEPPLEEFEEVPRVDEPNDGDQEGIEEEHYALLLHHTELLLVDIIQREIFHQESHDSRREEKSQRVLQAKRKFVLTSSAMLFDIREEMQHEGEGKFVEEDDAQHGEHGHRFCSLLHNDGCRVIRIGFYLFQYLLHHVALGCQDAVEDASYRCDEEDSQRPADHQSPDAL